MFENRKRILSNLFNSLPSTKKKDEETRKINSLRNYFLGKGSDVEGDLEDMFFPTYEEEEKSDERVRGDEIDDYLVYLAHLFDYFRKFPPKKRGLVDKIRKLFTFHEDPQKNMRMLCTISEVWREMEVEVDETNPLIVALEKCVEEINLLIQPLNQLFDPINPSASLFFSKLPSMIAKIAYDNHPSLLRGYLPFLQFLDRWRVVNPGIVEFIAYNIHYMNDVHIENFNSIIRSRTAGGTKLTFELLKEEVASAMYRRDLESQLEMKKKRGSELKNEFHPQVDSENKIFLQEKLRRLVERMKGQSKWISHLGPLYPDKVRIGMEVISNYVNNMDEPNLLNSVILDQTIKNLERYNQKSLQELFHSLQNDGGDERCNIRDVEVEDERDEDFQVLKKENFFKRCPPSSKRDLSKELGKILIKRNIVTEDKDGLERYCKDCGINLVIQKRGRPKKTSKKFKSPFLSSSSIST